MHHRIYRALLGVEAREGESTPDAATTRPDQISQQVVSGDPTPGNLVPQALPGFENTTIPHLHHIPAERAKGKTHPIMAVYIDIKAATNGADLKSILEQEGIRDFIIGNQSDSNFTFDIFPWVNHDGGRIQSHTPARIFP